MYEYKLKDFKISDRDMSNMLSAYASSCPEEKLEVGLREKGWSTSKWYSEDCLNAIAAVSSIEAYKEFTFRVTICTYAQNHDCRIMFKDTDAVMLCRAVKGNEAKADEAYKRYLERTSLLKAFKSFVYDIRELDYAYDESRGNDTYAKNMDKRIAKAWSDDGWSCIYENLTDSELFSFYGNYPARYCHSFTLTLHGLYDLSFKVELGPDSNGGPWDVLKWIDRNKDDVIEKIFYGDEKVITSTYSDRLNEIYYLDPIEEYFKDVQSNAFYRVKSFPTIHKNYFACKKKLIEDLKAVFTKYGRH